MRVSSGKARRRSRNRLFKEARGNVGGRSKLLRSVKETLVRARAFATHDRRLRKRDFRSLWITRLTAACRARGMSYSGFIHGLSLANIELNRKTLSELAISDPAIFDEVFAVAQAARGSVAAA